MEKKEIRKKVLDIRNRIPAEIRRQKSMEITDRVCKMSCFLRASSILIYRNFRSEVETGMLIEAGWEMGKEVFCPRVEGKEMEFYRVKIWEDFESGAYGIREPKAECPVFESQSDDKVLIVLPGAVFDKKRHRIGYGGGFYDRYLEQHPQMQTLAVCFEEQVMEEVPFALHDIRPAISVTDRKCYE